MPRFSVGVYNADVRRLNAEGKKHRDLEDRWAQVHYLEIRANDLSEARRKAMSKYPRELGYMITDLFEDE